LTTIQTSTLQERRKRGEGVGISRATAGGRTNEAGGRAKEAGPMRADP